MYTILESDKSEQCWSLLVIGKLRLVGVNYKLTIRRNRILIRVARDSGETLYTTQFLASQETTDLIIYN